MNGDVCRTVGNTVCSLLNHSTNVAVVDYTDNGCIYFVKFPNNPLNQNTRDGVNLVLTSAQSFVQGRGLDYLAPLVGLEPGFVRELIAKTHPPEVPKKPATPTEEKTMNQTVATPTGEPMIDAKQAANATRLPRYWFSNPRMRTRFCIPHYLIVGLVRYRISDLDIWLRTRYIPHQYHADEANGSTGGNQ